MENYEGTLELNGSEVAVIGMACRFPGARNLDEYWRLLRFGLEGVSFLTDEELDRSSMDAALQGHPNYVKAAALLDDAELFDASFFGYTPKEAEVMDPQQRLFLELSWEALENAGYDPTSYKGAIGVYAGARTNTYLYNLFSNPDALGSLGAFEIGLGNDLAFLSARVAYKLGLRGPAYSVHTACSTGLVAVHLACQSLLIDECQIAVAGGIAVNVPQKTGYLYQEGGIVSSDGYCRAFDAKADGTIFGSGAGIVVLKRLEDALADGDQIYAVIKGSACNNDGSSKASFTAPSVDGQARVVAEAIAVAGIDPETISYIETHGTGTRLGDPIEIRALTKAFRAGTDKKNFCAIGSVKSNFGHLDAAAGIASFIKTALALHHGILPASLRFEQPNPDIDFVNSPFYVNTATTEWKSASAPRRAGVSSFGIGGSNAHVILEEAPPVQASAISRPYQLILLSARTSGALENVTSNLGDYLAQHPEINLADAAYTLRVGRAAFSHRAALVCSDVNDAINALHPPEPSRVLTAVSETAERGIVFMFPGQGAQHINMGKGLYHAEPAFRENMDQCAEILKADLGFDLLGALYPDDARPEEANRLLNETYVTQPALFAVEYSLARLWMQWGARPRAMIGHSIGEYVAACLAGVISLKDALRLVAIRGQMMQESSGGDMLAVPLPGSSVSAFLNENLSLAAVNAPSQSVVSGTSDAINQLQQRLNAQGVETRRLNTSHAFHSHLMAPVVKSFAEQVGQTARNSPQIPYISSLTGTWITLKEIDNPQYWADQLRYTVRFAEGLKELLKETYVILLEVGPGQTLTRLAKQSFNGAASQMAIASLPRQGDLQSDLAFLLTSLGRLWLGGVSIDAQGFYADERRRRIALSTYPFEKQRYWIDAKPSSGGARQRGKNSDITGWFYAPSWKRSKTPRSRDLSEIPQCWLIFADECGVGAAILDRLTKAGHDVVVVKPAEKFEKTDDHTYSINPRASEEYEAVLKSLRERGREVNKIIHLWSVMTDAAHSDASFFRRAQDLGYYSLLFLTWALAKTTISATVNIEAVSNRMQDLYGEDFYPEKSTLLGPCIVVPQEYSNILCRSVDIAVPQSGSRQAAELTDQLIAELQNPSPETIIAYRGKHRWIRHYEPLPMRQDTSLLRSLRQNGVYLITGGLGSVGLILAEYLGKTVKSRLVLTRLSPFPQKDRWAEWLETHGDEDDTSRKIRKLQAVEEMGAEVIVASADVSDEEQMRSLVERIYEQFGELNGVLHAAGVTSGSSVYRAVTEIRPAESEAQFKPKVHGVYVLEKVLRGRGVDFCLLFSSNAAVLGGLGFVAYAAANLFMDNFACSRDQEGAVRWLSADWDHWPEETRRFAAAVPGVDQYSMTRKESEEAFRRVVCMAAGGQVVVSTGDLETRLGLWVNRDLTPAAQGSDGDNAAASHPRPHLPTTYVAPRNDIEQKVADVWRQVLGIQQVGVHDIFFDLGGHSLLVTQVIGRLREAFQIDLPLSKLFDAPTVSGLAEIIAHIRNEAEDQEKLEILDILSRLSEEEVEAEIAKRVDSHDDL